MFLPFGLLRIFSRHFLEMELPDFLLRYSRLVAMLRQRDAGILTLHFFAIFVARRLGFVLALYLFDDPLT